MIRPNMRPGLNQLPFALGIGGKSGESVLLLELEMLLGRKCVFFCKEKSRLTEGLVVKFDIFMTLL
jgi:hypothetical protein